MLEGKAMARIESVGKYVWDGGIDKRVTNYKLGILENIKKYRDRAPELRLALCDELLSAHMTSNCDSKKFSRKLKAFLEGHKGDEVFEDGQVFQVYEIALEIITKTI